MYKYKTIFSLVCQSLQLWLWFFWSYEIPRNQQCNHNFFVISSNFLLCCRTFAKDPKIIHKNSSVPLAGGSVYSNTCMVSHLRKMIRKVVIYSYAHVFVSAKVSNCLWPHRSYIFNQFDSDHTFLTNTQGIKPHRLMCTFWGKSETTRWFVIWY